MSTVVSYMYRYGSNDKLPWDKWFNGDLSMTQIEEIEATCVEGTKFLADQVGLMELQEYPEEGVDPIWHELVDIQVSTAGDYPTWHPVSELYDAFMRVKETGWDEAEARSRFGFEA